MGNEIEVIRSSRRSLAMELRPDGTLLVRAPRRMSMLRIRAFVALHADWIEKQRRKLAARPAAEKLTEAELAALKKEGRKRFAERAAYFAPLVGVRYGRIAVRSQHTKWGSCSARGNLNFNCLLLLTPPEVLDYVVVHELCHLLELNHSARFWQHVERVLPNWRESRSWLREHGGGLLARL